MKRTPLIAANWKMNLTHTEGAVLAQAVTQATADLSGVEVLLCPPFTALASVAAVLLPGAAAGPADHYEALERAADATRGAENTPTGVEPGSQSHRNQLRLGAQDVHWAEAGAFTGAVSPGMVRALGCHYVIVGHSERRHIFGEDDAVTGRKAEAVLDHGLAPIVCVGETAQQREQNQTEAIIGSQLDAVLTAVAHRPQAQLDTLVVAYEPVWAIGSGQAASPVDADQAASFIRRRLAEKLGEPTAQAVRILYGGSVGPDNARQFLSQTHLDGALVGGASLQPDSFTAIVAAAARAGDAT